MFEGLLLMALGLWSAAATTNALRPFRQSWLLFPSLAWSWMVIGMPAQHVASQVVLAALLVWLGALDHPVGWIGLVLLVASWLGSIVLIVRSRSARAVVHAALDEAGISRSGKPVPMWRVIVAAPFRGRGVQKVKNIEFRRVAGHVVKLDVYRQPGGASGRPALLYIHGGGWTVGDKREQGLPLMHHLARNGWVCFTANYRLSPGATFPDHLIDAKAALVWIKEHAEEYGADPSFIAIAGGSAGGHIAALVALTEGEPHYQPGFESADTTVQAAVPTYGIYDVTNRLGAQSAQFVPMFMEPIVMKAFLEDEPEKYRDASPIDLVHDDLPPFLVVQGDRDTLAPVQEARAFVDRLLEADARVIYMEFPGAQHIFDIFYSYQSAQMIEGVLAFLQAERNRVQDPEATGQAG